MAMNQDSTTKEFMRCLQCNYVLDHLNKDRCPECGRHFDPDDPETFQRTGTATQRPWETWQWAVVGGIFAAMLSFHIWHFVKYAVSNSG